jgi:DNA-binding response OmpR family regulator
VQRVLVVEDERELAEMLDRLLTSVGYQVDVVHDGQAGLHRVLTGRYDALVLDRGLPAIDVPDRVEGLDAGAQDHLGKPFDVDELLARLRSLLRRAGPDPEAELLDLGTRRLDLAARLVVDDGPGRPHVALSEREAGLLEVLARRPTRVFTREELRDRIFDSAESEAVVETYVSYLRRKLGPEAVRTVRGVGYRMGSV